MAKRSNPLQPLLNSIPAPIRNRYFLVLVLFFGWMIFIDKHDFLTQYELQDTHSELQRDKVYYSEKITEVEQDRFDLERKKEKYAREHYHLHKKDEVIFIFTDE